MQTLAKRTSGLSGALKKRVAPFASINVVVLESFPILRAGLVSWLGEQSGVNVVGQASDHASARRQLKDNEEVLLLMDLMAGGKDGLEFIRELREEQAQSRVLVFSAQDERIYAERVLKAGAHGYVMKHEPVTELLTALKTVASGELALSRAMTMVLLKQTTHGRAGRSGGVGVLTDRELHVYQMIGTGLSLRRIAEVLGLSIKTVETHRENIKNKLSLQNSSEVTRSAALWFGSQAW